MSGGIGCSEVARRAVVSIAVVVCLDEVWSVAEAAPIVRGARRSEGALFNQLPGKTSLTTDRDIAELTRNDDGRMRLDGENGEDG